LVLGVRVEIRDSLGFFGLPDEPGSPLLEYLDTYRRRYRNISLLGSEVPDACNSRLGVQGCEPRDLDFLVE
jgi:hypothetical protein